MDLLQWWVATHLIAVPHVWVEHGGESRYRYYGGPMQAELLNSCEAENTVNLF